MAQYIPIDSVNFFFLLIFYCDLFLIFIIILYHLEFTAKGLLLILGFDDVLIVEGVSREVNS
jgi:hypothetical protein